MTMSIAMIDSPHIHPSVEGWLLPLILILGFGMVFVPFVFTLYPTPMTISDLNILKIRSILESHTSHKE